MRGLIWQGALWRELLRNGKPPRPFYDWGQVPRGQVSIKGGIMNRRMSGVNISSPVIFLVGDEKYLKEKAINELRSSLLDGSSGELDYKVLHGSDTSANEILSCASTIPFFSSKRLIVVKDFEKLSKEDTSRIISYIKKPHQHTCLVVDIKDDDILDQDPALNRYIDVLKFTDLADTELSNWITKYISSRGRAIDEDALEILKESQGTALLNLSQELEKLITFVGSRKTITRNDVELLVGKGVLASVFDITGSVSERDASRALGIVYDLMSTGKKPYEIIGLLCLHFRRILKAHALISKGSTESSARQLLRIPRKNAKEFCAQVQSFSSDQIEAKMMVLLEADLSVKRPKYSPSLIMEFTIIRLCLG